MEISSVPPEQIDYVWAQVEPMVERGLAEAAGDSLSPDYLKASIKRGDSLLWAVHEGMNVIAVVALDVVRHPAKTTVLVVLIAGERFRDWSEKVQTLLREFAALVGADTIEAVVRDGMTKWLAPMGWRRKATLMELKNVRR